MKDLKHYTIIGMIFVLITGSIAHFMYDLSENNVIIGFFFPINESIWEHKKLVFFPMLLYSFYIIKKMKHTIPCITSSFLLGTLVATVLVPVLFYTYSGILGYNLLVLDLLTFALSVLTAFWIAYKATLSCRFSPYEKNNQNCHFFNGYCIFLVHIFSTGYCIF